MNDPFHPDLRRHARWIPRWSFTRRGVSLIRLAMKLPIPTRPRGDVSISDVQVRGTVANPPVRVRFYRPAHVAKNAPALLWIHGGGYIIGTPEQDDALCADNARDLGIVVASVDYRLAPEHPFPAPLDDCYAALVALFAQSEAFGIDRERIAIGGASAGGGLAAALAQRAHDRGEVKPCFQLLIYPMVDDRTALRTDIDPAKLRAWTPESNVFGWSSYLERPPGHHDVPPYAVPSRRTDLRGLAPAWMGVGTCDLFHDEDVEYARRLNEAGVPCDVTIVPGAFHGFDVIAGRTEVARAFRARYLAALRSALSLATT